MTARSLSDIAPGAPRAPQAPDFLRELRLAVLYFALAAASIHLTRDGGHFALIWPANAVAIALIVRWPAVSWWRTLLTIIVANALANVWVGGDDAAKASAFALISGGQIALTAWVMREQMRFPFPAVTLAQGVRVIILAALFTPAISAGLGAAFLNREYDDPFVDVFRSWWQREFMGFLVFAPPILLHDLAARVRLLSREHAMENAALSALALAFAWFAFSYLTFPFVFITIPLSFAAYRMGSFGGAILASVTALVLLAFWALGMRPEGLPGGESHAHFAFPLLALAATVLPTIALGLASDERRRTARLTRQSERNFRETFEHSPIGMAIVGLDGDWKLVNRSLAEVLGYESTEDVPPLAFPDILHPDEHESAVAVSGSMLRGETESSLSERRYRHRDGRWIWSRAAVSLARDEEGAPMHFVVQLESLEEKREAERALAEERERLQITLDAITDGVITANRLGEVTFLNPAAEVLLGHTLEQVQGQPVDRVLALTAAATGRPVPKLHVLSLLHDRPEHRVDAAVLHRPDGSASYVQDSVSPVHGDGGLITGMVIVLRDVTAAFAREHEIRHRASHDGLTGLANRFELERRMAQIFERVRADPHPAVLLAIDLDRFKAVNDGAGHATGDEMLRRVGRAISGQVRGGDTIARLGGDEFAAVLDGCDQAHALRIANAIIAAVSSIEIVHGGRSYGVGASVGIALLTTDMHDIAAWIAAADRACYESKDAGRGKASFAKQSMSA